MRNITILLSLLLAYSLYGQNYNMQNGSISTCSGTFYDSGGSGGNYGNNESLVFTICPDTPGTWIQLDFFQWSTQD
ncbi:MAG: hypothetical protein HKO90_03730, partial [Flavobacteriaceae bacterium]|nr:hypothetical protein [Flavobacteriaceae bacterium]